MEHIWLWVVLFLIIIVLGKLNQRSKFSAKLRAIEEELTTLAERTRSGQSTSHDLLRWDLNLDKLENYPNEFNKLDSKIKLRQAFVEYLELHYPLDERLPKLKAAAFFYKDTVWGFKINRD